MANTRRTTALMGLAIAAICGLTSLPKAAEKPGADQKNQPEANPPKRSGLSIDVVLESVDLEANLLTAKAYHYVIPPTEKAGGSVHIGNIPAGVREARFERLPVMPEAGINNLKLRPGMHVILCLDTIKSGAVAVVEITVPTEPEHIGIDWLDATPPKGRR
jgi:hypothetical protein